MALATYGKTKYTYVSEPHTSKRNTAPNCIRQNEKWLKMYVASRTYSMWLPNVHFTEPHVVPHTVDIFLTGTVCELQYLLKINNCGESSNIVNLP